MKPVHFIEPACSSVPGDKKSVVNLRRNRRPASRGSISHDGLHPQGSPDDVTSYNKEQPRMKSKGYSLFTGRNTSRRHWWGYVKAITGALLTFFCYSLWNIVYSLLLSWEHKHLSIMLKPTLSFVVPHPLMIQLCDNSTLHNAHFILPISTRIEQTEEQDYTTRDWNMMRQAEAPQVPTQEGPCQPMHEWQTQSYVNCNILHQVDIQTETASAAFTLLNCGGSRCAFQIRDAASSTPLVLKMPKQGSEPTIKEYERSRRDSMTMERLTKSPYVMSLYGCCGVSQVTEYANGGRLYDLIERFRGQQNSPPLVLPSIDKLRIGIQIVTALADLHSFENDGIASITHNDLESDQYVFVDGVYKLNDFHLSYFLEKDQYSGKVCRKYMGVNHQFLKYHAPEEGYGKKVDNEKADLYVAGSVMYNFLTSKWIFEGVSNAEGIRLQREGKRSPFPLHIKNSTDPADQAMMEAITMLWTHDPEERPRARVVSNFLIKELQKITDNETLASDGVVRVVIPPFPNNWDFTNEGPSWEENLW